MAMESRGWRSLAALALLVGAVALHTGLVDYFWGGLALWFAIAVGHGLTVRRWPVLIVAAFPWPLGIGVGLVIGRYAFLGEGWQLAALLSLLTGLIGIALGVILAGRSLRRR